MKTIKYSISLAALAFVSASMLQAADYVYGNTTGDGGTSNNTFFNERNWYLTTDASTFDYATATKVGTGAFNPTVNDNLWINSVYSTPSLVDADGNQIYNVGARQFNFSTFIVNDFNVSIKGDSYYATFPGTPASGGADTEFNFRVSGNDTQATFTVAGTWTAREYGEVIMGAFRDVATMTKTFALVDINKVDLYDNSKLRFSDNVKEIRIGVDYNEGTGVYTAKAGNSIQLHNTSQLSTDGSINSYGTTGVMTDAYFGNIVGEAGSVFSIKGSNAKLVGTLNSAGTVRIMHTVGSNLTGDFTLTAKTGDFDLRLGTYTGTVTNMGGRVRMDDIDYTALANEPIFNGTLLANTSDARYEQYRGTFNGVFENEGRATLGRKTSTGNSLLVKKAEMFAKVTNKGSFTAKDDAEFTGSMKAIGISSETKFIGQSKANISNETLHLQNAKISVGESAKMLLSNTDFIYDFDTAGGFSAILEFEKVSNVDALSVILGADFGFMNIEEGYYDLIRFLDGNMYSSLAALIGETLNFQDKSTYDIFEGTFLSNSSGVFGIEFVLIPEPSTYAAIFGILALALAAYRRRK